MIQYIKFGQNTSFGSTDRVQTSFLVKKSWHSKCLCDLENEVMVTKSNNFFPMSQSRCFCASLVKSHQLVQEIECRKGFIFKVFIVWWTWKLAEDHQNLISSFNYPNDTIHKESLARIHHLVQEIGCRQFFSIEMSHSECWCDLENEVKVTKIYSFLSHVSEVFLCKFSHNPPIGPEDRMQTRLILIFLHNVVTLKIMSKTI